MQRAIEELTDSQKLLPSAVISPRSVSSVCVCRTVVMNATENGLPVLGKRNT